MASFVQYCLQTIKTKTHVAKQRKPVQRQPIHSGIVDARGITQFPAKFLS